MTQYGVIGRPIGHSLSPRLHRLIYEQAGYRAEYSRFDVDPAHVDSVPAAMRTLGIRGINVTAPHKRIILPYMDELSPTAAAVGAVNTVLLREDGSFYGDNTDCYGFIMSLRHAGISIAGNRFALCGSGGASLAVRHALETAGASEILTASTNPDTGIPYSELLRIPSGGVIVNCTPLGMRPHEASSPVDDEILARFDAAVDLIYNPLETLLLQRASALGLRTLCGLWMLIYQGLRSFEIWSGCDASSIDVNPIYSDLWHILEEGER